MKRQLLERHMSSKKSKLEARAATLKGAGVADDKLCCDPMWRHLDAARRQAATRLGAVGKLEKREAEVAARKEGGGEGDDE